MDLAIANLEEGALDSVRIRELERALWEVAHKLHLAGSKIPRASSLGIFLADARADAIRCLEGK